MDWPISHGLDRGVARYIVDQRICPKTVILILLIHFLKVHVVHPLVGCPIDSELVRYHLFVYLQGAQLSAFLAIETLSAVFVMGTCVLLAQSLSDVIRESFGPDKG